MSLPQRHDPAVMAGAMMPGAMTPWRMSRDRLLDSPAIWQLAVAAAALFLLLLVGYPIVYNLVMSVQNVTLGNLRFFSRPWVGLQNYRALLDDPLFWLVTRNTVIFTVANVAVQFMLGLALALYFQLSFPGGAFLRGLVLVGWMLPPLVIGAVWKWLLASDNGVINYALQSLGLVSDKIYWLSDPSLSLLAVTMANIWFGVPFNMILLAAGLAGIPADIYEAAALDGAGPLRRFIFITLPLLRPTIYALLSLSTVYTMRAFDLIYTMTHGGPLDSSNIFPVWSYRMSFELFNFGGGAAIATAMFVLVLVVAVAYVRSVRAEQPV
jgi:multiple sugar transport system permease protein